ncbi:unnamed protein product [Rotaria socialis]|uniref:Integrase catalytic domain-containing protein n=2 Tax=Rotaria socialis TaxID=392032 RepID=A0A821E0W4_9BILA|nr:unnamed protein product [Rotaria socialis]
MRKDVFNYVQSCLSCQQFKHTNAPTANPIQLHTISQPWRTIGINIMGLFPTTSRQKRFLLVIVDYFTRWVELFALRQATATHIANILFNEIICRYGVPLYILSDNGPQFISHLFNEICANMDINRKFTANYQPQTNMSEHVNRTLKAQIDIYAQRRPGLWDKELQKLAFTIRTPAKDTTSDTSPYLNLGCDPVIPLDLIINQPVPDFPSNTPEYKFIQQYRTQLAHDRQVTYYFVREH